MLRGVEIEARCMWLIPAVGLHVAPENKKAPEAVRLRCTTIGRLCPEPRRFETHDNTIRR
jgi:hypothetical protein